MHVYSVSTVEPLYTGTSVNRNSLETGQMSRSRIFSFYFHCIKIPVNRTSFVLFLNDFNTIYPL